MAARRFAAPRCQTWRRPLPRYRRCRDADRHPRDRSFQPVIGRDPSPVRRPAAGQKPGHQYQPTASPRPARRVQHRQQRPSRRDAAAGSRPRRTRSGRRAPRTRSAAAPARGSADGDAGDVRCVGCARARRSWTRGSCGAAAHDGMTRVAAPRARGARAAPCSPCPATPATLRTAESKVKLLQTRSSRRRRDPTTGSNWPDAAAIPAQWSLTRRRAGFPIAQL